MSGAFFIALGAMVATAIHPPIESSKFINLSNFMKLRYEEALKNSAQFYSSPKVKTYNYISEKYAHLLTIGDAESLNLSEVSAFKQSLRGYDLMEYCNNIERKISNPPFDDQFSWVLREELRDSKKKYHAAVGDMHNFRDPRTMTANVDIYMEFYVETARAVEEFIILSEFEESLKTGESAQKRQRTVHP